jgi:hypothetical protein
MRPTGYATSEPRGGESPEKLAKTAEMWLYASREILRRDYLPRSACQHALEKSHYRDSADSEWKHIASEKTLSLQMLEGVKARGLLWDSHISMGEGRVLENPL